MNVVHRFFLECGEKRKLTEIPPAELDSLLCIFYISAKKKDNTEYELTQCLPQEDIVSGSYSEKVRILRSSHEASSAT